MEQNLIFLDSTSKLILLPYINRYNANSLSTTNSAKNNFIMCNTEHVWNALSSGECFCPVRLHRMCCCFVLLKYLWIAAEQASSTFLAKRIYCFFHPTFSIWNVMHPETRAHKSQSRVCISMCAFLCRYVSNRSTSFRSVWQRCFPLVNTPFLDRLILSWKQIKRFRQARGISGLKWDIFSWMQRDEFQC